MFSMVLDVWHHIQALKPAFISKTPHFNFITVHYFWIIGMALAGSVCIYAQGNIAYIDALFFGSGVATQSGLNTVDVNLLTTWQQIVCYIIPMMTNPITINSFVVFLRLYWFEKRFQTVAKEAKKGRRSIAKTLSKARTNERDIEHEERGVNGRHITVMHDTTRPNGMTHKDASPEDFGKLKDSHILHPEDTAPSSNTSGNTSSGTTSESGADEDETPIGPVQRQITFADQVKRSDGMADEQLRVPAHRTAEEHIAFLEEQRKRDKGAVLRIPGPRDADAGIAPEAVDEMDPAHRTLSRRASTFDSHPDTTRQVEDHVDPSLPRRNITIAEPTRAPATEHVVEDMVATKHAFGALRFRRPSMLGGKKNDEENNDLHPTKSRISTLRTIRTAMSRDKDMGMPYLSWEATVGRNSAFVDLTEEQREELGGIEYRSLKSLALILVLYFWGFSIFGVLCLLPWILTSNTYGSVVTAVGQGRPWWALFTSNSAFTDLGFTLTPDSMISFQTAIWPLVAMSFLIIIGNTGFPIMLRIIIWVTSKYVPRDSGIWEELKFLLDHPRRCFTLLFPSQATWWLFWILVILNGLDLVLFIVLDLNNHAVISLPVNIRILGGWFQAVSTRTAGFAVVNLAALHPAIQVSYLIMMYISVLPIAISVRRTNVYEEKSLGIYGSPTEENEDEGEPSYVGAHLRRQLSFDLWYIFLGFFIIAISEGGRIQSGDPAFTMFTVLFEIVSAYGTVGLSLGYTNINASFSAEFGTIAKLVIIAMQIRGRHRGLPYELDRAILLPSEHLQKKEAQDATLRMQRRSSGASNIVVPVNSASKKSMSKTRSRSPTVAQNFLSSMLHPGPVMPNSHRNVHRGDMDYSPSGFTKRRHSIGVPGMATRGAGGMGPGSLTGGSGRVRFGQAFTSMDGIQEERRGRVEGRRNFFQEGVNPPRPEDKDKAKEA